MLPDDHLLAAAVLFDLIGQDETVHSQCGADVADIDKRKDIDEQMRNQRDHNRQYGDEKGEKDLAGKPLPASDCSHQIEQLYRNQRQQGERVQGAAIILVFRRDIEKALDKHGARIHDKQESPHAKHDVKQLARAHAFTAAVQQVNRQHGQRQREQKGFKKHQKIKHRPWEDKKLEDSFEEAG